MALWICDGDGCQKPAVQRAGDCELCDKHHCRQHLQTQWHKCPKPEVGRHLDIVVNMLQEDWGAYCAQYAASEKRQMNDLLGRINVPNLCRRASSLRNGVPCTVDLSAKALSTMMGGQNCHADIKFDDDVCWLIRLRQAKVTSPPVEIRDHILRSEAATMTFLRTQTNIPVPQVFDWACESDPNNDVGVGYMLMEKLQGQPLDWQSLTTPQREKIMQQLVEIFLEIEQHPFDVLGSIITQESDPKFDVQGIAHHSLLQSTAGQRPSGPFQSSHEAVCTIVEQYLNMIASGEIGVDHPIDVFLAHRFRVDVVNDIWTDEREQFFLKHPDDKGDHIIVDESLDIIGIIDWEWTRTASKEEAFSSPCMMWPVAEFYDGSNDLHADEIRLAGIFDERGRPDLAQLVVQGRKVQRFFFALGPASGAQDRTTFTGLFNGLREAFLPEHDEWNDWRAHALEKYRGDSRLQGLQ